jgi:hypothetical protein
MASKKTMMMGNGANAFTILSSPLFQSNIRHPTKCKDKMIKVDPKFQALMVVAVWYSDMVCNSGFGRMKMYRLEVATTALSLGCEI